MDSKNQKYYRYALIIAVLLIVLEGCATGPGLISPALQGENLFSAAERAYENGQINQAKTLFEKFISMEPDSHLADNAFYRLGEMAITRKDYMTSTKIFQALPNKYPNSELIPAAKFQAARSLYLNLSWDKAKHALKKFQEDFPLSQYNPQVMLILSDIYIKTREYATAREIVVNFLDFYPESSLKFSALYQLGLTDMYLGELDEAIQHLTVAMTGELPDDQKQDALYALGTISLMREDLLTAVEYFSNLVKDVDTGVRKDRVLKKVKGLIQEQLSDEELKAIVDRHPNDFPGNLAMIEIADRQFDRGELTEARQYLERFLSGFPGHPEAPSIEQKLKNFEGRHERVSTGKFGCIAPLTGPLSGYGEKMTKGVKMAIEEYNQKYVASVKVVLFDSMAKPENAQKGVELLAYQEQVAAIIGPLLTSTAMPAASKAEQIGIPLFTPTATGDGLPEAGRFIFRNCLTNLHQAEALATYAVEEMGLSRLGILFPFNAYGQEMMALFSDKIEALGANIEIIEFYDQDDTDFKDQLVRIHQISPEALFLPGSYEKIVLIAPQIPFYEPEEADPNDPNYVDPDMDSIFGNEKHSIGFLGSDIDMTKGKKEIQLLGTDGWFDFRLIREGDSYVENAIFSVGFFPESRNLLVAQFVSNFQKRYGEPPDIVSAQAYDATNMLLEASSGGEASWDTIRKNISQIKDFPGVSGRTTIMPSGDSIKEVSLLKVKRRRFVPVERLPFNQNYRPDGWMY